MKILVTGGAGFIGSHIVDAYCDRGYDVVVIDDLSSGKSEYVNEKAIFVEGDITDPTAVESLFTNYGHFSAINHLAAQKSVTHSVEDPAHDAAINVVGSLNIFQAAHRHGVKRLIFSSTGGAIYGENAPLPCPETAPAEPISPYGIAKLSAERYLAFYGSKGMITQALRYSNVYGPRQDPHGEAGVVAIFCQRILNNQQVTVFGDGQQTRDFIYVGDVVRANLAATDADISGLWNIGTGQEMSVLGIANQLNEIAKRLGYQPQPINHEPERPGELRRSAIDGSLAKEELGFAPSVSLAEGLELTLRSFAQ